MLEKKERGAVVFSDLDGSLVFHRKIHGMQLVRNIVDGLDIVFDPRTNTNYLAYDIKTNNMGIWFTPDLRELGKALQTKAIVVFVTGARRSTLDTRLHVMDFFDYIICESGGMIMNSKLEEDAEWKDFLSTQKPLLEPAKQCLHLDGWVLDIVGREYALRVRLEDNPHKTEEDFENLISSFSMPGLKTTKNTGHFDVLLENSGKGSAVKFLMQKLGNSKKTFGIGDDDNDIEMLKVADVACVLRSSYPKALEAAKDGNWFISEGYHFEGTKEIFEHIIMEVGRD